MLNKVRRSITHNRLIPPGARVLAAVSGGVDSMVMLDILQRLSGELGFYLCVGHVNHNMRGEEARLDAESVRLMSERLGLDFRLGEIPASEWRQGGNRQERARELRFELLRGLARELSADFIATAHNADDQAETIIDRLLRGSGPHGLSGIARLNGDLLRPLLDCTRAEIVDYAHARGLNWREDRSNADRHYRRSYIRHEIMPQLRRLNPQAVESICNAAQTVRSQSEAIDQWAGRECSARSRKNTEGGATLNVRGLEFLPSAVQVAVFQHYLKDYFPGLRSIGRAQLLAMQQMLDAEHRSMQLRLPGALLLLRTGDEFRIAQNAPSAPVEFEITLSDEGIYSLPDAVLEVHILTQLTEAIKGEQNAVFDLDKLSGRLRLRSRKPGDAMALPGTGHCKVSKILSGRKLAPEKRAGVMVFEDDQNILWLPGIRRSSSACVDEKTTRILQLVYRPYGFDID